MPVKRLSVRMRVALAFAVAFVMATALSCASFRQAQALYNDVAPASKYSQSQGLTIPGDPIGGADIPDGTYNIEVSSSSTMCLPTNCVLIAQGGNLYASFDLTGAYTALCFGTADDAAAQADDTGREPADSYYLGNPVEGDTPHHFEIPVPALNTPVDVATYTGGRGFDEGMWYSRQFSFNSSSEVDAAINGGGVPAGDDQDGENSAGDSSDGETSDQDDDDEDAGTTTGSSDSDDDDDNDSGGSDEDGDSTSQDEVVGTSSTAGAVVASSTSSGGTGTEGGTGTKSGDASGSSASPKSASSGGIKARSISLANAPAAAMDVSQIESVAVQDAKPIDLAPYILGAMLFVALDMTLVGAFIIGLRRAKPR